MATTIAPVQDGQLTELIHDDLAATGLAPAEHVVDAAYLSPARIQRADQIHNITLLGPIAPDPSAQAMAGSGFDKSAFVIDWERQVAICPRGSPSRSWGPLRIKGHDYIQVRFDTATCRVCPVRTSCTASAERPRALALLPRPLHEIQTRNRAEQADQAWQARYAIRAGCESTISENVRVRGLRRTRYRGLAKTHLQHVLTAMACNLARLGDWLNATPKTRRRASRFHTLCQALLAPT
ncbi:transposase [Nonomuraea lactucae]|uniref:transposase n=1 Tax=Nonomuraea lactucae TaxID=2249762 RepID=UPI0013B35B6B|nr:transposase [Nonomuraea lactucae]